jgi:hypothetical protein
MKLSILIKLLENARSKLGSVDPYVALRIDETMRPIVSLAVMEEAWSESEKVAVMVFLDEVAAKDVYKNRAGTPSFRFDDQTGEVTPLGDA